MNDEHGNEILFEFLDLIRYEDRGYVVLLPVHEEDGEVVILEVEEFGDDAKKENYVGVESLETLDAVFAIFKEKFKNEFDFED